MSATVHVVARFIAKPGKEEALKAVLNTLIAPTRRELGCYQYDLLFNPLDPQEFTFVERWESDKAVDQHDATKHLQTAIAEVEPLVEVPPDIRRYHLV